MIDVSFQQDHFEVVPTLVQPTMVEALKSQARAQMGAQTQMLPEVHALPVSQMLQDRLASFDPESEDFEAENAFYVADLGEVFRQHKRWKTLLSRIEPFFGMYFVCPNDPNSLQ